MVSPSPIQVPRGRLINLRVNDAEYERLVRLAEHYGVNLSSVVRMLARRDAVALGLEPATSPTPPPKPAAKSRRGSRS